MSERYELSDLDPTYFAEEIRRYLREDRQRSQRPTREAINESIRMIVEALGDLPLPPMIVGIPWFSSSQDEPNEFTQAPWDLVGEPYGDDIEGYTLEEIQAWSDKIIREVKGE